MRDHPRKKRVSILVIPYDGDDDLDHPWFKGGTRPRISEPPGPRPVRDTVQDPDATDIVHRPRAKRMSLTTDEICATAPWYRRWLISAAAWVIARLS